MRFSRAFDSNEIDESDEDENACDSILIGAVVVHCSFPENVM
jgi:hypothetical protein